MELQPHPNSMFQQLVPHQQQSDLHLHPQQQQPQQPPPHPQQQQQPQHHASHFMLPQQKLPQQSHPGQMNAQLTYQQLQHLQSQQGIRPQQPLRSERPEDHPDSIVFPGHSGTRQAPFNLMLHGATHVASPFPSEQFAAQQHTQQANAIQQMQQLRFRAPPQDQFAMLQQQQERARLNSQPTDVHGTPFPPTQNGFSPPGPPQQPQQGPRAVPAQQQSVPGVRRIPSQQQIGAGPPTAPFSGNGLAVGSGSGSLAVAANTSNGGMMASSGMQMDVGQAPNGGGMVFSRPINSIAPMGNGIRMQQVQSSEGMVVTSPFGRPSSSRQMTPQMMDMAPGQTGRTTVGLPMYGSQQGSSILPNSFSRGPSGSPHQGSPHSQPYSTPTNVPTSTPRISSATNTPIHRGGQPPPNPNPQTFYPPAPPQGTGVIPQSGSGSGPVQGDPTRSQTSTPGSMFPPQLADSRDSLQVQMYAQQSQPHIHPHQIGQQPQSLQQHQQSQSQQLQQPLQQGAPPRDMRQPFQPNEMQVRQQQIVRERAQQLQQQAQQQHPLQQQQSVQQIGAPDAPSMGFARTPSLQPSLPYPPSSQIQPQQPPSAQAQQPPGHHLSPTEQQGIFPYRPPLFSEDTLSGSTTSGGSIHSQSQSPHNTSFPPISGANAHSSPGSGMIPSVQALAQGHFGPRRVPAGNMPPPGSEQNQSTASAGLPQSRMSIAQHHPGMLGVSGPQTPLYARPSEVQMRFVLHTFQSAS
ncbi:hypothetical protein BS47DRAFT_299470 [Hydnum rufescens UP504]|uniref:Uncharacterized protein n=1 Tax=Hydnum rufescens UP504 TaxID=1448309 RepID=A0A9P6B6R0_9AGAM|nr:hypothetical protein BS47DRAFT_299470 [Hydnum rufescens UP504]